MHCCQQVVIKTASFAAEGVGHADPPHSPRSASCLLTAEITGVRHAKIARATLSSLNAHRSSIEPPPRPTISTSRCSASGSGSPARYSALPLLPAPVPGRGQAARKFPPSRDIDNIPDCCAGARRHDTDRLHTLGSAFYIPGKTSHFLLIHFSVFQSAGINRPCRPA